MTTTDRNSRFSWCQDNHSDLHSLALCLRSPRGTCYCPPMPVTLGRESSRDATRLWRKARQI